MTDRMQVLNGSDTWKKSMARGDVAPYDQMTKVRIRETVSLQLFKLQYIYIYTHLFILVKISSVHGIACIKYHFEIPSVIFHHTGILS